MVIRLWLVFWIFCLLGCGKLSAQNVVVEASVNENPSPANQPIKGTITITHEKNAAIDESSFSMDKRPLKTTAVQETQMSSGDQGTVVSIYSFVLPQQVPGAYVLSPISVKVKGQTYQSTPSSYEIRTVPASPVVSPKTSAPVPGSSTPASRSTARSRPSSSQRQTTTQSTQEPAIFRLQAFVDGSSTLYPGQRAKLMYRISYNRSIDLTSSSFPLLETKEFRKIGDEQIEDYQSGSLTIQDISQEIEAFKPGTFQYGPSAIEGYAYQINALGGKAYWPNKLRAEAPGLTVTVKPFPIESQPASFNGSIGKVSADLKMLTPTQVKLSDNIELQLTLKGIVNLHEAILPDLRCQPGFSGFFHFDDLPPTAYIEGEEKHFKIILRPISSFVKSIPSIELSSFDPNKESYLIWRSEPISLELQLPSLPKPEPERWASQQVNFEAMLDKWQMLSAQAVAPIEIEGQPVSLEEVQIPWTRTFWVLWMIPVVIAALGLQLYARQRWLAWKAQHQPLESELLLRHALRMKSKDPDIVLKKLQDAIATRLQERGWHNQEQMKAHLSESLLNHIQSFFINIEEARYGHPEKADIECIKSEAKDLWMLLKP